MARFKMRAFIFSIFFLISFIALSQQSIPGYMGKRFSVSYTTLTGPAIRSGYDDKGAKTNKLRFNFSHSLDLNYVVHYRKVLCIGVQHTYIGLAHYETDQTNYIYSQKGKDKLNSFLFSLGIKLFKRSRFAPLGSYVKWEALFGPGNIKYKEFHQYDYSYYGQGSEITYKAGTLNFTSFGTAFSFGWQRIFNDKIIVEYGLRGAIVIPVFGDDPDKYILNSKDLAFDRYFWSQFANVKIAIGWLAF